MRRAKKVLIPIMLLLLFNTTRKNGDSPQEHPSEHGASAERKL